VTDSKTGLLDQHHRTPAQIGGGLHQNSGQQAQDAVGLKIGQSENNDADRPAAGPREDRTEIQIRGLR
jgi:hypothetical protein